MSCTWASFRIRRRARFKSATCARHSAITHCRRRPNRGTGMRFLRVAGLLAFGAFLIALAIGLTASFGTRFGFWDYRIGLGRIFPYSLYFGGIAFVAGLAWVAT